MNRRLAPCVGDAVLRHIVASPRFASSLALALVAGGTAGSARAGDASPVVIGVALPDNVLVLPVVCRSGGNIVTGDACTRSVPKRLLVGSGGPKSRRPASRVRAQVCPVDHGDDDGHGARWMALRPSRPDTSVSVVASGDVGLVAIENGEEPFDLDLDGDGQTEHVVPVNDLWGPGKRMTEPRIEVTRGWTGGTGPLNPHLGLATTERVRVLAATDVDRNGVRELWVIATRRDPEGNLQWIVGFAEYGYGLRAVASCVEL